MAEIKNPEAYFATMVRNSYKDEYRANDNFYNHISSVGDESDIQLQSSELAPHECDTDFIEQRLSEDSAENWLLFMEHTRLHTALSSLPMADVDFLLQLAGFCFNKAAFAKVNGVSQQSVSKRFHRLRKKILVFL